MSTASGQTATIIPARARNVTAVLGPTNTGKTHLAIERMIGHETGMIGLPLRLLAREVYDRVAARVGADKVALVTGEEKIKPEGARFWVSTVEAMPLELQVDFVAIDEIQLAADPERGHVFTERLLNMRGMHETLLLGSQTMREPIQNILNGANFVSRPRLSTLTYAGQKKISRLPRRSAIVAFSAADVYEIAELIRRQRGGAAVVLGALSPRTRNSQVELFQSGDVDFLIATDAVGMGLNLDVDHVAFAGIRKFDGLNHRRLTPSEIGQIAGRAGRHMKDGTFGVTADVEPFEPELIERLENHSFEGVKTLQWRNRDLDFSSLDALRDSLKVSPGLPMLARARMTDDVIALETLAGRPMVADRAGSRDDVERLWDVCQVPDYRKISSASHADFAETLFGYIQGGKGRIPEDWFAAQVAGDDRTDGDLDTLSNRLANVRTWTFVAHRSDWLADHTHWQERTREVENRLSDALHEQLTQRFVDKRTSALVRRLRDDEELFAEIGTDGAINVEQHYVGRLDGLQYVADTTSEGLDGKAARSAAARVLTGELGMRTRRITAAKNDAFKLDPLGHINWQGSPIAALVMGDDPLKPTVNLLADEHLAGPDREKIQTRLDTWITDTIADRLRPLVQLTSAEEVSGLARGMAFQMREHFGILKRDHVANDVRALDQEARAQLRRYGVRFGAFNIFMPMLLKPAATELVRVLWGLRQPGGHAALPEAPRAGLTSLKADPSVGEAFYRIAGFHLCGPRAVRIDMLERLSDMIRPLVGWRKASAAAQDNAKPEPRGATGDGGFVVQPEMMSILGCSAEELGAVLNALGFKLERRSVPVAAANTDGAANKETSSATSATEGPDASEAPAGAATDVSESAVAGAGEPQADAPIATTPEPDNDTVPPGAGDAAATLAASGMSPAANENTEDIGAGGASAEPEQAATLPAEPEFVEIWRPRRRNADAHGSRARHRGNRGAKTTEPGAAQQGGERQTGARPGDSATDEKGQSRRQGRRRRGADGPEANAGGATQGADGQRSRPGDKGQRDRPSGPRDQRPRDGENRRDRDRNRQSDNRQRAAQSTSHAPRRREADPDSPFAALAKLKADLDAKAESKDKGNRP